MKKAVLVGLILVLIVITGCKEQPKQTVGIQELVKAESIESKMQTTYQPDRASYGYGKVGTSQFLIADVLQLLPPLPDDFWMMKSAMMSGMISMTELSNLSKDYYEQPEFIANTFVDNCIPLFYREPDTEHWTPEGYGTFPHTTHTQTIAGQKLVLYTFVHTSCGVERYQGLGLVPVYPSSIELRDGTWHSVDAEATKRYIKVDIEPKNVLTAPTYPLYHPGWIQKVSISVEVSPDAPKGVYAIGFDVTQADSKLEDEWIAKYKMLYQTKGMIGIGDPQFIASLAVVG